MVSSVQNCASLEDVISILGDPDVKSVFVNVFGGITACDAVANGIVQALELLGAQATWPPLPGVTPPTTFVPDANMRRVCFVPSEPVMP